MSKFLINIIWNFFTKNVLKTASFFSFLLILYFVICGSGPKVTAPPRHKGERIEPALAFPVPFCFQGFFPLPLILERVLVLE